MEIKETVHNDLKINLKIVQGNIPDNFKDQIVDIYLYGYYDELGIQIGAHSVIKEFFYIIKRRKGFDSCLPSWKRRDICNQFFRSYLQTFFCSTLARDSKINIPVGRALENIEYDAYGYGDKYILNIKRIGNDDIYFSLKDVEEDWGTEIKKVDISIINKWMNRRNDEIDS